MAGGEEILTLLFNIDYVADYVIKIIKVLLEVNIGNKIKLMDNKFIHINIELMKDEKFNWIQLTNSGQLNHSNDFDIFNIIKLLYYERSMTNIGEKSSFVYLKIRKNNHEIVYDLRNLNDNPTISNNIHYSYLKEYILYKIEYQLTIDEMKIFNDNIIKQLLHIQNQYANVKYTFYAINGELLYTNIVELDYIYTHCQLLSSTITQILKLSVNNEFREKCFELLNIDHSQMANDAIMNILITLFNDNYQL